MFAKEDVDDQENTLSHFKFHGHGTKDTSEQDRAKQIVSDFEKKRSTDTSRVALRNVALTKPSDKPSE